MATLLKPLPKASSRATCGIVNIIGTLATVALGYFWGFVPFAGPLRYLLLAAMAVMAVEKTGTVLAWIAYEPTKPSKDNKTLPFVTVVIPAYNESSFVGLAMDSIRRSDYPRKRLQIVAIDDGSTDDTWKHIQIAATALETAGISCVTHRHESNLGKRTAICTGFHLSKGDIIVSLDSDSILHRKALRNLVAPMLFDAQVGGVAGHLTALNVQDKVVPRLLDILFNTGGNIPRAAQSHVGSFVTILPGALSAFRASAVRPLLDGLCESTFLGEPLRHGEDVELTMGLLQAGWTTKYQSSAVVYTTVPETLVRTLLMYTRWERSSYVYLCMGFFRIALNRVLEKLRRLSKECVSLDENENTAENIHVTIALGSKGLFLSPAVSVLVCNFYLLLNLVTTAVSNPMLITFFIIQIYHAITRPETIPLSIAGSVLHSFWTSLLFVTEALEEEGNDAHYPRAIKTRMQSAADQEKEGVTVEGRKARLSWQMHLADPDESELVD
ncbi:hypothetical protein AK830_g928 [Neonectria ditissima]|uniref:Glycosyltransferase 2-like domain-containing protein n=1 Tax=Neonectria ditissima TaxID=78410 RepID=A0A0P7BFY2_9HYPO|nr:hypothetical protein AK830_g928 [Neonectria ditissima]